ncbi:MAG: CoB--CoM heterodisulfide reductase iron-sulfur subunit A family protein [bacterium]
MEVTKGVARIGVYICQCGTNIAGIIDPEVVTQYTMGLPNVTITRYHKYMCSSPGQELIYQDVHKHKLNRIIVAACSPLLHEKMFRNVVDRSGLNSFTFHMVNIREQVAWVHDDREAATAKAKNLIRAAVYRIVFHKPLEQKRVGIHPDVLVVGGGIAGIHAALTIANAGRHVYLIEREPAIGGHMAKYDKTFPTLDCAACILTPKMTLIKTHPNITLWTYSEIKKAEGYVGSYKVQVKRRPRYINEDLCVGCMECIKACVYKEPRFPNEFDLGLGKRKPIYIPFPQAVPQIPTIDAETCIQLKSGKCKQPCATACGECNAVDFEQEEAIEEIEIGAIIISTGFKTFDPIRIPRYGYGAFPNIYTAMEVERLINASGPTSGKLILQNGQKPKKVGIIHCVGSRDVNANQWCSRVCCMYSFKLAHLIKEHTKAEIYNFYMDIRSPGKSMEEFYNRVSGEGVHFIRGRVAEVVMEDSADNIDRLILQVEDTLIGRALRIPLDMVVLAVGMEPRQDAQDICRMFKIPCSTEGFHLELHPKLAPVNTLTEGIFLAGCCQGPKDIPDTVTQAGAAASEVLALIDTGYIEQEPYTANIIEEECSGCKTCIPLCPYSAIVHDRKKGKAFIEEVLCRGCGVCVSACPSGSIKQKLFEDEQIFSEIEGILD